MSKISTYSLADEPLQLSDRLIGTEAPRPIPSATPLATKNFSLGELLLLFSSNFPAASLQAVLDTGNTATEDINLTGTINTTLIKPGNIIDMLNSQGTPLQILSKGVGGICWIDGPDLSGYVPTSRELTINGVTYDLSANRSWTVIGNNQNLQDVTDGIGNNETTNDLIVKYSDGLGYSSKTTVSNNYVLITQVDDVTEETNQMAFEMNGIVKFPTTGGEYKIDMEEAANAVPPATTRKLKAPVLSADAIIATTNNIGTWGALDYPTWTAGTPFVKMTAAGTFALDTNTYLTSITSSDVITALGYTPVTNARTLTINGITYDLSADRNWTIASGVSSVGATLPITSSGGSTPNISTSMATNKLIGRSSAGTGVMEEITIGSGLTLAGGTLSSTSTSPLTTKGDIYTFSTVNARLGVGLDTQVLIADSTTPTGLKWGSNTAATPTGYYAMYQDVLTQTVAVVNTGYPIKFRTLDLSNGVTVVSDSRITFANTGIYNLQFSVQLQNSDTQEHDVTIWLRKNGVDVVGSSGFVAVVSKHGGINGHVLPSWNYLLDVVAGEYYELVWSATSTQVTMPFIAAGSPPPSTASAIFTVTQQAGIMAGTGITAINSLTGAAQTLATNGSGTDFNIVSSGTTHTFNLPTASATNRGALSSTDWSTFNNKAAKSTTPIVLKAKLTNSATTGTADVVVDTLDLSVLGTTFCLDFLYRAKKVGTASQAVIKCFLNTTATLSGSPILLATFTSDTTARLYHVLSRNFTYSGGVLVYAPTNIAANDLNVSSSQIVETTVDITNFKFMIFTIARGGGTGDTITSRDLKVIGYPPVN